MSASRPTRTAITAITTSRITFFLFPVARAFTDEQARTVFLTVALTGLRRSELQALRWRDVNLAVNELRVRDSKSETGIRTVAIAPSLAEALWQHRRASYFQGDDERVCCHPTRGTMYEANVFREKFRAALKAAGVEKDLRPFHDLRHASLTNGAAAGESPLALKTRAGHASMATTEVYLHLAGVAFHDEAAALERRLGLDVAEAEAPEIVPAFVPTSGDLREPRATEDA